MSTALKRRAALLACVPALLWVSFGVVPSLAAAASPEETPLTPELVTLAEPAVAGAPEAEQAEAIGLPTEGPGSLVREGEAVVVEAHFEEGALASAAALEAAGATVLETSGRYQTVALSVAPEDLEALAEVPGLEAVEPSREPIFYAAEPGTGAVASVVSNGLCEGGSVISQAMTQLNVAAARGVFGARGAGQTIGVISDSFNAATEALGGGPIPTHAHEDEVTNDLPGPASTCSGQQVPVRVLAEGPAGTTDEGRAMLQTIHDLAPHAQLAFATAYSTELQFAHNIELLAAPVSAGGAGADVIVDDVGYLEEPFFQDGPVAVAIDNVTKAGVTYLTAAGNNNLIQAGSGAEFASWEREEFDDGTCPSAVAPYLPGSGSNCMNFSPTGTDTTFGITVSAGATLIVDLQWAEPWYGVDADLNAFLIDSEGNVVKQTKKNAGNGSVPQPVELLGWQNKAGHSVEVQLVIGRCVGFCNFGADFFAKPRTKLALMEDGAGVTKTEYPKSSPAAGITVGPTIYGHAGAAAAITLAAANYEQPATAPVEPERYSSRGPVTHYFGPVVSSTEAAKKLPQPEELEKPNVTATDCASTTFFAGQPAADGWHFCGTSEAAPHAAAVVALMRQTQPSATPNQILTALESTATPFTGVKKRAAVGAGLVNAEAAIAALGGAAVSDPASVVVPAIGEQPTPIPPAAPAGTTPQPSPKKVRKKPKARIVAHPKPLEKTHKSSIVGRFRFAADQKGVTFSCQVDKAARRRCAARYKRRFGIGHHVLKVRAVDSTDHTSSAPVSFRFRVKRVGQ